jgi:hypothetical protein
MASRISCWETERADTLTAKVQNLNQKAQLPMRKFLCGTQMMCTAGVCTAGPRAPARTGACARGAAGRAHDR